MRSVPLDDGGTDDCELLELEPGCGAVVGAGVAAAGAHAARTIRTRVVDATRMRRSISSDSNLDKMVVLKCVETIVLEMHLQKPER